jgi:hypothetical protein
MPGPGIIEAGIRRPFFIFICCFESHVTAAKFWSEHCKNLSPRHANLTRLSYPAITLAGFWKTRGAKDALKNSHYDRTVQFIHY